MSSEVAGAGHDRHGHHAHSLHSPHSHSPHAAAASADEVPAWEGTAPVWWSVQQRLYIAFALMAVLWLVIAWAARG